MLLKKYALPCLIAASLVTAGCESRYMAPLLVGSAAVIGTAALVGYAASQEKKKKDPAHQASATLYDQAPVLEGYDGPYRAFFSESRERSGDYVVSLSDASSSSFDKVANQRGVSEFLLTCVRRTIPWRIAGTTASTTTKSTACSATSARMPRTTCASSSPGADAEPKAMPGAQAPFPALPAQAGRALRV